MPDERYQLPEEIILKTGTRHCSGRIRDGKFLYYFPGQMGKDAQERVITAMRPRLQERLRAAYAYHPYFVQHVSTMDTAEDLHNFAARIYARKYLKIDFTFTIKFRRQKTVMGTYRRNANGEITVHINGYFKNAPEPLLEYIIAHELSHHHCSGHDKAFYRELQSLCPDYTGKRKLANAYLLLKEARLL